MRVDSEHHSSLVGTRLVDWSASLARDAVSEKSDREGEEGAGGVLVGKLFFLSLCDLRGRREGEEGVGVVLVGKPFFVSLQLREGAWNKGQGTRLKTKEV